MGVFCQEWWEEDGRAYQEVEGFVGQERFECRGRTLFDLTIEVHRAESSVD